MFKIENSKIHCNRGDNGLIKLRLPIVDINNYMGYKDISDNIYWYDSKTNTVYNEDYTVSSETIAELTQVFRNFDVGETVRFNIYEKSGYDKEPLVTINNTITAANDTIEIELTEANTTIGENINRPTTYWYDISLNEDVTVVGYNEEGPREFILYPAKGEQE